MCLTASDPAFHTSGFIGRESNPGLAFFMFSRDGVVIWADNRVWASDVSHLLAAFDDIERRVVIVKPRQQAGMIRDGVSFGTLN